MTKEQVHEILRLKEQLEFASNQIIGIDTTRKTLEERMDMRSSLRMDLTIYTHGNIVITRVAVPTDDLDDLLTKARTHWEDKANAAAKSLEAF